MNQTEKQSIEALAVKLLMEIEQHTTLCIGDFERNIFLQGVNAGYNAALESYKDGWVSVEEKPQKGRNQLYSIEVLCTTDKLYNNAIPLYGIGEYCFDQDCWIGLSFIPTHWQPLPTPPQTKTI